MPRPQLLSRRGTDWLMLAVMSVAVVCGFGPRDLLGQEPMLLVEEPFDPYAGYMVEEETWGLQILPENLIYAPYLAGPKESRTGIQFFNEKDSGWLFDVTLGGQIGILRIGTDAPVMPRGIQFDLEGSAQIQGTGSALLDVLSTDIRVGFPITIGWGKQETKLAFYALRSYPSQDFTLDGNLNPRGRKRSGLHLPHLPQLPTSPPEIFGRRAVVLGHALHPIEQLRLYGELGYAIDTNTGGEWEAQFGVEFAPARPTNYQGSPFAAVNMYLLERNELTGTLNAQLGWAWRGKDYRLLRVGLFYQTGASNSFALADRDEQQFGFGIWHDF